MRNKVSLSRRQLLILASSSIVAAPLAALAKGTSPDIHVVKNPQCGSLLTEFKIESGFTKNMISCHTGKVDGYFIEGHVPASDIKRLIADRPDALGLAVPAMPYGSPGMGPEEEREAYDVFIVSSDGATNIILKQEYPFKTALLTV